MKSSRATDISSDLARYYDGCIFHRLIKGFMAQTGDPDPVTAVQLAM